MDIFRKIFKVIRERPTFFYPYLRQTWLFYQTRLLYKLFKPKGIELGKNVRIQSFSSLRVQLPDSKISIGDHSLIWEDNRFEAIDGGKIEIGTHVDIVGTTIVAKSFIKIGNFAGIGQHSYVQDCMSHPVDTDDRIFERKSHLEWFFPSFDDHKRKKQKNRNKYDLDPKPIIIEDSALIYRNCVITRGVTIGKNAVVGAGSVITKDIPANTFAAGNPAVVIRRF